jgi:TfoX/Sxy family transcriptional regulator of competence genes
MKAWSAALEREVSDWPQVSTRSFFGLTALYRKDKMFAALPRTRALETANSLAFRLESPTSKVKTRLEKVARPWTTQKDKARWFAFEFRSDADMHDALEWLATAYDAAGQKKKPA